MQHLYDLRPINTIICTSSRDASFVINQLQYILLFIRGVYSSERAISKCCFKPVLINY